MTTALVSSPPAPLLQYHRPPTQHHHSAPHPTLQYHRHQRPQEEDAYDDSYASSSSSTSSYNMQNHPPLRTRVSATTVPRCNPPIPPSLLDSPLIVNPNSPFRRDHAFTPSTPSYSTGHDRLNLLDTVPMGSTSRAGYATHAESEPAPDDIGVAGTPKSARSSSITVRSTPLRPPMGRGNSWLQQQQSNTSSLPPPHHRTSPAQSTLKLPSTLPLTSSRLPPISTPYPPSSSSSTSSRYPASSTSSGAPTSSAGGPS